MVDKSASQLEYLFEDNKNNLFRLSEFFKLESEFGILQDYITLNDFQRYYDEWISVGLISKNSVKTVEIENYFKKDNKVDLRRKNLYIEYVLFNMLFNRCKMNKNFIIKYIFGSNGIGKRREKVLFTLYNENKPSGFPDISEIKHNKNIWYAVYMVLICEHYSEMSEKEVVDNLFYIYRLHSNRGRDLKERIKEFSVLFYPYFCEIGLFEKKFNIVEHLVGIWAGRISDIEDMWLFFLDRFNKLNDTEFYIVLKKFIEECLEKDLETPKRLKTYISDWFQLTVLCVESGVTSIPDIKNTHRDRFINKYIENTKMENKFHSIRKILKFYNDILIINHIEIQDVIYKFSSKYLPRKPVNINHVGLMHTGLKALISSVGSEIISSRRKKINEMKALELNNFIVIRIIWIIMLSGSRVGEVIELLLNDVKKSIQYNEPYLYLPTLKDNHERELKLDRGGKISGDSYELDIIHLNILKESIEAAEFVYGDIEVQNKYLFPNSELSMINNTTVYLKLESIQKRNGIVCGSQYDILSRELYESFPKLRGKLERKKALFTTHDLRHGNLNWLLLHGGLNKYEIQEMIGHTNVNSQNEYLKTNASMLKVAKSMEANGHYGAENELVSPDFIQIDSEVERPRLFLYKDVGEYLDTLETNSNNNVTSAENYIDKKTDCNVEISCSASGMSCLACNDFQTGEYNDEKMENISIIFINHINTIDIQIDKINNNRRSLLAKKGEQVLINAIKSLLDRFILLKKATEITLISSNQGFSMNEKDANRIVNHICRKHRKMDLDPAIVQHIKKLKIENKLPTDLSLYKNTNNRKIFV